MIDIDGEPWFPAKDVCDMLGVKNSRSTVASVCEPDEHQQVAKSNVHSVDVSFPNRGMLCVNESGAYAMIFASRKQEARAFRKWVTSVVLPSIRKNGGYIKDREKVATGEMTKAKLAMAGYKALQEIIKEVEAKHARAVEGIDALVAQTTTGRQARDEVARTLDGANLMIFR